MQVVKTKEIITVEGIEIYPMTACKGCGGTEFDYAKKVFKNGTKHVSAHCRACGRHNGWVKQVNPEPIVYG